MGADEDSVVDGVAALPPLPSLFGLKTAEDFRSAGSILMDRWMFLNQAGITFGGLRDTYQIFGYKRLLTNRDFRDRYDRGGIAGAVVDVMPDATWRGSVELREAKDEKQDTPFEKAWKALDKKHQIQAKLVRVDKLSRLSNYAVLLIGAPGELEEELPRGNPNSLLYLAPFSGGGGPGGDARSRAQSIDADCTIQTYDLDTKSPRFGQPLTYQLKRTDVSSPELQRPVHWTRILHVAEGLLDNDVYGRPVLQRSWNLFDDLEKVTGGGAEAFWLRANAGLHLDVDKDMAIAPTKAGEQSELEKLKQQAEDYAHQLTRMMRTRGVSIKQLSSGVADFHSPADAILTQIAGANRMPKRILTGSEMGELASSQDRDNWKDQVNGRQTEYAGPYILRPLVDRFIAYGYLPQPAGGPDVYDVVWPHIQTLTEAERADGAAKWAQVNSAAGFTVFSDVEIRDHWYSMAESDEVFTESWRATLALKMAMTNKTQGATIFTDDEIRETCYGWKPLTTEQKVPITAPERVSATAPTPPEDLRPGQPAFVPKLKVAEAALLKQLEAAIEADDLTAVGRLLDLQFKYGTTQVQLPPDVAERLFTVGRAIADEDIYEPEGGRETDAHVTIKYGLLEPDAESLANVVVALRGMRLGKMGRIQLTLGETRTFSTPNYDVVYASVVSPDLASVRDAIATDMACAPSDHGAYIPHATIAYVKPGRGKAYVGLTALSGIPVIVDSIVLSDADGNRTVVSLTGLEPRRVEA